MDAPSKPLFTLMTEIAEPSLEGLSKPETIAKKCMKNEECTSTSIDNMCKPMRIRVKACRKIPWIAMALQIKARLWLGGVVGDASKSPSGRCLVPSGEAVVLASARTARGD